MRRVDRAMLEEVAFSVSNGAADLRLRRDRLRRDGEQGARGARPGAVGVKTERFGPTG